MSAVVSAVTSVFKAVGNAVGDIVEGIGDIVETVVEEVVEPVVKAVGNTIEAAMDDPLGTIAKIGVAIYAPSLLPAFNFGYSVATGVPLEKALLNTGLNMIGAEVGNVVGGQLTCTFDLGCMASDVVTAGAKGAVSSGLKGQNIVCGAVGAMATNLVNTGAKELSKCLSRSLSSNCTSGGLPVTASGSEGECAVGCASTQNLGALPSGATTQVGDDQNTVNITGNSDVCTDLACTSSGLTRGLGTIGSAGTTDTGATTGTGALDTVTVTGGRPTCTDLTCVAGTGTTGTGLVDCTFDPTATGDKGTVVVTGK
jgi:hypothetical protein